MKKSVGFLALVATLGFLLSPATAAQDRSDAGQKSSPQVFRTPDLLGKTVKNYQGENLGRLEDFVIELKSGKVLYGVLGYGEILRTGGKMFAIQPSAFKMADDQSCLVLDVAKAEFDRTNGFDTNKWPAAPDMKWGKGGAGAGASADANRNDTANRNNNARPADTTNPRKDDNASPRRDDTNANRNDASRNDNAHLTQFDTADKEHRMVRLSSLNGLTIKNPAAQDLGKVQGFAIDMSNGKIVYAALGYGGVAGVGAKLFAVPWQALDLKSFDLKANDRSFVLDANRQDFENQNGFDKNHWPIQADMNLGKGHGSDKKNP